MTSSFQVRTRSNEVVTDPPLVKLLFNDTRFAVVWLVIRVLLGLQWIQAGLHKLSDPAWTQTGEALKGFWANELALNPNGSSKIAFDWYRGFLQGMMDAGSYTWFSKLVVTGELLVGVCLIIGAFVGIAAFIGGFMNWNFIMAGTASSNGLLFAAAILLILAWKTAGYWGADRFLLRAIGTPWHNAEPSTSPEAPQQAPAH